MTPYAPLFVTEIVNSFSWPLLLEVHTITDQKIRKVHLVAHFLKYEIWMNWGAIAVTLHAISLPNVL
jgi:hypothetical protein